MKTTWSALILISIAFTCLLAPADAEAQLFRKRKKNKRKATQTEQAEPARREASPKQDTAASPAEAAASPTVEGPQMSVKQDEYPFGRVAQGEVIRHRFELQNTGNAPLLIRDVKPSCGCTIPEWPEDPIKPGETAEINVRFNTAGKLGKQKKAVTVYTNMDPNGMQVLYLVGEVYNPLVPDRNRKPKAAEPAEPDGNDATPSRRN